MNIFSPHALLTTFMQNHSSCTNCSYKLPVDVLLSLWVHVEADHTQLTINLDKVRSSSTSFSPFL